MKSLLYILIFVLIDILTFGQSPKDFPSSLPYSTQNNGIQNQILRTDTGDIIKKHRELIFPETGVEYYTSGNIKAKGTLKRIRKYELQNQTDSTSETIIEYERHGYWTVYYDNDSLSIRSFGYYFEGEKNGKWSFYKLDSNLPYLTIEYDDDIISNKLYYSDSGEIIGSEYKTKFELFLIAHMNLILLIALIPITLLRILSNLVTYNKINKTDFLPFGWYKFTEGAPAVNFYTAIIFWWKTMDTDTLEIKRYKKTSNVISIISIVIFLSVLIILSIYGLLES